MTKTEFLKMLATLFPSTFFNTYEKNGYKQRIPNQEVMNAYKSALGDDIDFGRLYKSVNEKHTLATYAPSVGWLVQEAKSFKPISRYTPPPYDPQPIPESCLTIIEQLREKHKLRKAGLRA